MRIINCIVCGVGFSVSSRTRCCSQACRDVWARDRHRQVYFEQRERRLANAGQYYRDNRESRLDYQRRYREANLENRKNYERVYVPNSEKRQTSLRRYRENNHEKIRESKQRDYAKGAAAVEVLKKLTGQFKTDDRVIAKRILKQLENTQ